MKKKLRIHDLRIQSFITELDSAIAKTAKGGDDPSMPIVVGDSLISFCGYYNVPKDQSLFPYNGSAECTKITTTTTTTHQ